jgi:hypothetical protein
VAIPISYLPLYVVIIYYKILQYKQEYRLTPLAIATHTDYAHANIARKAPNLPYKPRKGCGW